MREQFSLYLQKIRMDEATIAAILDFSESSLPAFIRRFFKTEYRSLYEETNPDLYEDARGQIFSNAEADAENRAAGGAYSQAMKYYAGFLRSKYFSTATLVSKQLEKQQEKKPAALSQPLREGAMVQVRTNKYERNPELRKKCIAHYGYVCQICGLDFTKAYGDLGKEYIEVHHIVPISTIKKEHEVDPIRDLIPLCSNCHSMIHRGENRILTPDELREMYIGVKWDELTE